MRWRGANAGPVRLSARGPLALLEG